MCTERQLQKIRKQQKENARFCIDSAVSARMRLKCRICRGQGKEYPSQQLSIHTYPKTHTENQKNKGENISEKRRQKEMCLSTIMRIFKSCPVFFDCSRLKISFSTNKRSIGFPLKNFCSYSAEMENSHLKGKYKEFVTMEKYAEKSTLLTLLHQNLETNYNCRECFRISWRSVRVCVFRYIPRFLGNDIKHMKFF